MSVKHLQANSKKWKKILNEKIGTLNQSRLFLSRKRRQTQRSRRLVALPERGETSRTNRTPLPTPVKFNGVKYEDNPDAETPGAEKVAVPLTPNVGLDWSCSHCHMKAHQTKLIRRGPAGEHVIKVSCLINYRHFVITVDSFIPKVNKSVSFTSL